LALKKGNPDVAGKKKNEWKTAGPQIKKGKNGSVRMLKSRRLKRTHAKRKSIGATFVLTTKEKWGGGESRRPPAKKREKVDRGRRCNEQEKTRGFPLKQGN